MTHGKNVCSIDSHLAKIGETSNEWQSLFYRFLSKPFTVDDDGNMELLEEQPSPEETGKLVDLADALEESRKFMELLVPALSK